MEISRSYSFDPKQPLQTGQVPPSETGPAGPPLTAQAGPNVKGKDFPRGRPIKLPRDVRVEDLRGACPGAAGRVRLRYGTNADLSNARMTASEMAGLGFIRNGAFDTFTTGSGDLSGATPLWVAAYASNRGEGSQSFVNRTRGADSHSDSTSRSGPPAPSQAARSSQLCKAKPRWLS